MVGYATAYTMLPVFSLVLDRDVNEDVALLYPELYKELTKGRSLSYKTFFSWMMISIYQGQSLAPCSLWPPAPPLPSSPFSKDLTSFLPLQISSPLFFPLPLLPPLPVL